jgi:hypothetical protein
LVSYCDVAFDQGSVTRGGSLCTYRFTCNGREYLVEDSYCPNPDCRCREVHLLFLEWIAEGEGTAERVTIRDRFMGRVSLDGRLDVVERHGCTREAAKELLSAWWERFGDDLDMLESRYKTIKEIGRRSLARRPQKPIRAVRHRADRAGPKSRPTRNAPCPCGSGKKYKKCCGRDKPAPR